ncbi:MAG: biosynthetic arginine decarboxylase [Planctomycetes bacterium]|nr:biosynthetic arginine decarboxylase [Planctomycetota bacterium]
MREDNQEGPFDADSAYNISGWGEGFFEVSDRGNLCVHIPGREDLPPIDIARVVYDLASRGIGVPVVLRFHDVLRRRVEILHETFAECIRRAGYEGSYIGIYPVKVNQMREVVEEIVDAGRPYQMGLEAGSKTELLAVLAYHEREDTPIILNGHKDDEFVRLALQGGRMGLGVIIVAENIEELRRIMRNAVALGVRPRIGLRGRISARGNGRWSNSSGDQSKFGFSISDIVNGVEILRAEGMLNCLELFHFHPGSQISDLATLDDAISESTRIYTELIKMGAPLRYLDIGGGLAIDYEGTHTQNEYSKNYSLEEYANSIIERIAGVCREAGMPVPDLISESGRYVTAHHSCIVTSTIGLVSPGNELTSEFSGGGLLCSRARKTLDELDPGDPESGCCAISALRKECREAFRNGEIGLVERAAIESDCWKSLSTLAAENWEQPSLLPGLQVLEEMLRPRMICNFSVFQSTADCWGIEQVLPILPITRLNERPEIHATIADITCDSYGKIDHFIGGSYLRLHSPTPSGELIGIFLTGAYQDVMGDMHNLFGRVHEAHIFSDPAAEEGYYIEEVIPGSSKEKVLGAMQYNSAVMRERIHSILHRQMQLGKLDLRGMKSILGDYLMSLESYTYLGD